MPIRHRLAAALSGVLALALAAPAFAQEPPPQGQPGQRPGDRRGPRPPDGRPPQEGHPPEGRPPEGRREPGQPINVRIEITITDQRSPQPATKTVSLTVADRENGFIRSQSQTAMKAGLDVMNIVPLNVDAFPAIEGNRIRLRLGIEYHVADRSTEGGPYPVLQIRENLTLILESAKAMQVTQSADPMSDRKVTLEVKATILK